MKKHLGSTIALVFGILSFIGGISGNKFDTMVSGLIIVCGALAYRSAKRRWLGEVKHSWWRISLEVNAMLFILAAAFLKNNLIELIETDPIPHLIVPFWALVPYVIMVSRGKGISENTPP
jgi:LytS/YehU family sensor histidine kinase